MFFKSLKVNNIFFRTGNLAFNYPQNKIHVQTFPQNVHKQVSNPRSRPLKFVKSKKYKQNDCLVLIFFLNNSNTLLSKRGKICHLMPLIINVSFIQPLQKV